MAMNYDSIYKNTELLFHSSSNYSEGPENCSASQSDFPTYYL